MFTPDEFSGRMNRLMPSIAIMNLYRRAAGDRPNVVAVGCAEDKLSALRDNLARLVALIEITKINIGQEMTKFIESIKAIAISL